MSTEQSGEQPDSQPTIKQLQWGGGPGDRAFRYQWMDMLAGANISHGCYRTLMTMAQRFGNDIGAEYSFTNGQLGEVMGCHEDTVRGHIKTGVESGWLLCVVKGGRYGKRVWPSRYKLAIPASAVWPQYTSTIGNTEDCQRGDPARLDNSQPGDPAPQPGDPAPNVVPNRVGSHGLVDHPSINRPSEVDQSSVDGGVRTEEKDADRRKPSEEQIADFLAIFPQSSDPAEPSPFADKERRRERAMHDAVAREEGFDPTTGLPRQQSRTATAAMNSRRQRHTDS